MRRTLRPNAGEPPGRFEEKYYSPLQDNTSNHNPVAASSITSPPMPGPGAGRNNRLSKPYKSNGDAAKPPPEEPAFLQAAFPTKEFPRPEAMKKSKIASAQKTHRDSMDAAVGSRPPQIPEKRFDPSIRVYLLDGRWIDKNGHTMHGLAQYYDENAETYREGEKDRFGDSMDRNAAFRVFMEKFEAERTVQSGAKVDMLAAFEKWYAQGGFRSNGSEGNSDTVGGSEPGAQFRDKKFGDLHFKFQSIIIDEIEEDLALYPPTIAPEDGGSKSFRYVRDILGIPKVLTIQQIKQQIEDAKKFEETVVAAMPKKKDYVKAKAYLLEKGLPVMLIEVYNYLGD